MLISFQSTFICIQLLKWVDPLSLSKINLVLDPFSSSIDLTSPLGGRPTALLARRQPPSCTSFLLCLGSSFSRRFFLDVATWSFNNGRNPSVVLLRPHSPAFARRRAVLVPLFITVDRSFPLGLCFAPIDVSISIYRHRSPWS